MMNSELVVKLIEASTTYSTWQERYGNAKLPSLDRYKFCENIVRECIEQIERVGIIEQDDKHTMYVDALKERFGL